MIKHLLQDFFKKTSAGFSLLECLMVLSLMSLFFIPVLKAFKNIAHGIQTLERQHILIDASDYVGAYLFRWAKNPNTPDKIDDYYYNGSTLEYAQPLNTLSSIDSSSVFPSQLKTTLSLYESSRDKSALILAQIWFDDDNDNYQDSSELHFSFTTLLTEIDEVSGGGGGI